MEKFVILITDVHLRKAFDIVNILSRYKSQYQLILTSNESISTLSILYGQKVFLLRKNEQSLFDIDLASISSQYRTITYVPVEEDTTILFYKFLQSSKQNSFKYVLPEFEKFILAGNKYALNETCLKNNIPAPRIFNEQEIFLSKHLVPVVIKPRNGAGSKGLYYVNDFNAFREIKINNFDNYIIQEKIGNSVQVQGAFLLCKGGEIVDFYAHRRLRTYPVKGGVSVLAETTNNQLLLEVAKPLVKLLNWNGLMMIEYLFDEFQEHSLPKVIEINPRLWGSILLSEFSKSNVLHNYIKLSNQIQPEHTFHYEVGKRIRWFFPYDLLNILRGSWKLPSLWNFNTKKNCFINFTYSNFFKTFFFYLLFFYQTIKRKITLNVK